MVLCVPPFVSRLALIVCVLCAGPSLARELTGSFAPRDTTALPDGLLAEVQVWAETGETAHATLRPKGQPPFDFALKVPEAALLVQTMLRAPNGQRWVSRYIRVPAGPSDRKMLDSPLDPMPSIGFASVLACGTALVQVGFAGNDAFALREARQLQRLGSQGLVLVQMKSVGAKRNTVFSDGRSAATVLDVTGPLPRLVWQGIPLPPCLAMPDPATATVALRGRDAAWSGRLTAMEDAAGISVTLADGTTVSSRHALPWIRSDLITWHSPGAIEVSLYPGPCRLSGHLSPFPAHVDAFVNGKRLFGCAGEPAEVVQGDWQLLLLNGQPVPAGQDVTLSVRGTALTASAGCNQLAGQIVQTDSALHLTLSASTREACADQTAQTEAALLAGIGSSTGFDLDQDGRLLVLTDDRTIAIFRRR